MINKILKRIADTRPVTHFMSAPSPRWLVLLADVCTVIFSCLLVYLFNKPFQSSNLGILASSFLQIGLITGVYTVVSIILRTYCYIVRLSAIEDIYRLLTQVVLSSIILGVCSASVYFVFDAEWISLWNIFTIAVISFSIMMIVRLAIRYLFNRIKALDHEKKRVIIFGSAINSFVLAAALAGEVDGRYKPVAFLSLSSNKIPPAIGQLPVIEFNPETVKEVFHRFRSNSLLFLSTQMDYFRSGIADVFLKNGIHLLMLNQIEEINGKSNPNQNVSTYVKDIKIEDLLGREVIKTDNPAVSNGIKEQVVLVTGAAGSIGSEISNQLATLGAKRIILVDQAETPMHDLQLQMSASFPDIEIVMAIGDITNLRRMEELFSVYRPRYVFHAAAYKHVPMMEINPCEAVMTNIFGTKNIADLAVKYGAEKFVMISTDKAVNPTNVMGASKRIAEIYVQSLFYYNRTGGGSQTTRFITTRFGNVLGSNGSVIPLFRKQIENGGPVTITHRDIIRYFMTIPEACSLVLEAGIMGNGGEIFIFDMGQPVKIYDLAMRMISLAGLKVGKDIDIIETGLRPGEKLYEELLNNKENTIPTHHSKIMIAKVRRYNHDDVLAHLNKLYELLMMGAPFELVKEMNNIVPEYKSNNSVFEQLDKKPQTV